MLSKKSGFIALGLYIIFLKYSCEAYLSIRSPSEEIFDKLKPKLPIKCPVQCWSLNKNNGTLKPLSAHINPYPIYKQIITGINSVEPVLEKCSDIMIEK
jgi:hypothetical protein